MSREDFFVFMEQLRPILSPSKDAIRDDCLTPDKKLVMVLYYLKDQGQFSMTANTFDVTVSMMPKIIRQVTLAINYIHGPRLIKFPETADDILKTTKAFEIKFGVPQVLGCVDGIHVPIIQRRINARDYYCYKMK